MNRRLFLFLLLSLILSFILLLSFSNREYTTSDIADYGVFKGNYDNETPAEFVLSFFPPVIEDYFSNTSYYYRALKGDTYAFEVYLEFTISDPEVFRSYLKSVVDLNSSTPYMYNDDFFEYSIFDLYDIDISGESFAVDRAKIGKVLFDETEQRFVFWALGVHDGGFTRIDDLDYFFTQYGISPVKYAENLGDNIYA